MNPTGKAGKPRNKPPDLKGATQFQRFVETAEALGADDGDARFLRALDVLAPPIAPRGNKKVRAARKQPPSLTTPSSGGKIGKTTKG